MKIASQSLTLGRLFLNTKYFTKAFLRTSSKNYSTYAPCLDLKYVTVESANGAVYDTGYIDILPEGKQAGTILALHGSPGSSSHFIAIVDPFLNEDCRVILANWPGYGVTTVRNNFKLVHSNQERVQFITDFLKTLQIESVDMLVAYSAAGFPSAQFLAESNLARSAVFLNTGGISPHRSCRPYFSTTLLANCLDIPLMERVMMKPFTSIFSKIVMDVNDSYECAKSSTQMVTRVGFEKMTSYAETIKNKQIPMLFAISKSDKIIEVDRGLEMIKLTGVLDKDILHYDANKNMVQGSHRDLEHYANNRFARALIFERGGHNVLNAYHSIILHHMVELFKSLK